MSSVKELYPKGFVLYDFTHRTFWRVGGWRGGGGGGAVGCKENAQEKFRMVHLFCMALGRWTQTSACLSKSVEVHTTQSELQGVRALRSKQGHQQSQGGLQTLAREPTVVHTYRVTAFKVWRGKSCSKLKTMF